MRSLATSERIADLSECSYLYSQAMSGGEQVRWASIPATLNPLLDPDKARWHASVKLSSEHGLHWQAVIDDGVLEHFHVECDVERPSTSVQTWS